jgi:hypothetical protein
MAEERVDRARKMVRRIDLVLRSKGGGVIRVRVSYVCRRTNQMNNELQQRASIDLHAARRTPLLPAF